MRFVFRQVGFSKATLHGILWSEREKNPERESSGRNESSHFENYGAMDSIKTKCMYIVHPLLQKLLGPKIVHRKLTLYYGAIGPPFFKSSTYRFSLPSLKSHLSLLASVSPKWPSKRRCVHAMSTFHIPQHSSYRIGLEGRHRQSHNGRRNEMAAGKTGLKQKFD